MKVVLISLAFTEPNSWLLIKTNAFKMNTSICDLDWEKNEVDTITQALLDQIKII